MVSMDVSDARFGPRIRSPLLEISNAMVRLYKDAFGRGPTKVRAHFAGPDTLVVLLEDTMTVAERNLVAMGEDERIREIRSLFGRALERELRDAVERILERRSVAYVSGFDTQHDLAVEVFTFEPIDSPPVAHADGARPTAVR
jgi:uncharacterized protein YbcI